MLPLVAEPNSQSMRVVVHQVAPAVARAHKPATDARKAATGAHGQRPLVLPRQQHLVPGHIQRARRVPGAAAIEVRSQQRVNLQPRYQVLVPFQPHAHQQHAVVRVADDLLGQRVAAVGIAIDVANPQRLRMDVLECREQVALLLVDERLAVGHQELHVPHLGAVDRGVVDLVQNAVRAGEPDPARRRVGRSHRVLHARGPARLKTRARQRPRPAGSSQR